MFIIIIIIITIIIIIIIIIIINTTSLYQETFASGHNAALVTWIQSIQMNFKLPTELYFLKNK